MGSLAVLRLDAHPAAELAARSCDWTRESAASDATLVLGVPEDEAAVLGAFQRASEVSGPLRLLRRGSGGAAAYVGPGVLWMQLALARTDVLLPCNADKLLNRYVRPLLRALTRVSSAPASYFGRDWISSGHRPVALVAFGHDASTGRCIVEAMIGVDRAFALAPRRSFLGKEPASLEDVAGRRIEMVQLVNAIEIAYRAHANAVSTQVGPPPAAAADVDTGEPPWAATLHEAIGTIGAGRDRHGRLRLGGEIMASTDAVARLEARVAELMPDAGADAIGLAVDEAFTTRGAIVFGVRALASIRDVLVDAATRG
jgi:hypothetical protein